MDINKIISMVRFLKEEGGMSGATAAPTNKTGPAIPGTSAGETPPVFKRKKYIYGKGFRKNWLQRRKPPQM